MHYKTVSVPLGTHSLDEKEMTITCHMRVYMMTFLTTIFSEDLRPLSEDFRRFPKIFQNYIVFQRKNESSEQFSTFSEDLPKVSKDFQGGLGTNEVSIIQQP